MIRVLEKAFNILEFLAKDAGKEYPLSVISKALDMDSSTCANIMKTLTMRGYTHQSAPRGGYKLGYMAYELVNSPVNNEELTMVAAEELARLCRELGETVLLSVIRNNTRIVLCQTEPENDSFVKTDTAKPIYATNTGRVILANYKPALLEKFISVNGLPSVEDWPEVYGSDNPYGNIMNLFTSIRRNGYEVYSGSDGTAGVAAPLFLNGIIMGSIGVCMQASRMNNQRLVVDRVLECAGRINGRLLNC